MAMVIYTNEVPRGRGKRGPVSVRFKSQRVKHTFDRDRLARGPAKAIRDELGRAMKKSRRFVKPSTRKARESAERAYRAGKHWARERYRNHAPNQSTSQFGYDSGLMAEELEVARVRAGLFGILAPPDRMVTQDMRAAVPELAEPGKLFAARSVKAAVAVASASIMKVEGLK